MRHDKLKQPPPAGVSYQIIDEWDADRVPVTQRKPQPYHHTFRLESALAIRCKRLMQLQLRIRRGGFSP